MPARKKPEETKFTAAIPLRVTPELKRDLDEMAEATGVSTSERARHCLQETVKKWRKEN
jgi:predicted HicB family RNase H-like nuclease